MRTAKRGALGGASNEAGASHRAGVAALLAVYGLLGEPVPWLLSDAPPVLLRMEADLHVDDVVVDFRDGTRVFIQAKLSAGRKAFEDTVDQWCRAVASGECKQGDELLLVVARTTATYQSLADALVSRRDGASPTAAAAGHLQQLRRLAAGHGLDASGTQRLLDAAAIRVVDARDNNPGEALGTACLNAAVVLAGHGQAAFRAMRAAARTQAEQRSSSDQGIWRSWLTDAHLPLTADASGSAAARLEAGEQAIKRYRAQWAQTQDVLPLADLGLGLTSMTVPGMTKNLRATPPGSENKDDKLVDAVRRQGRLFLVGRPGAGKTVASRLIAARWAANDRAPVPVWLRLRDLIPRLPATGPYRLEVRDLIDAALGDAQPLLAEALLARVEQGQALLILDALDETLGHRDPVVEAVADLIGRLPADLDILVTSRHSCLDSAGLLRLPVYRMQDPWHLADTLDRLLLAVAEQLGDEAAGAGWKAERRARIAHSRHAEPDLWRIPLMATLMVLLIAHRPVRAVPSGRAGLLQEVIDSSVRQWEMRRTTLTVPDTAPELTADVLFDCFDDIARLVAAHGSAPWQHAHSAVSDRLQQHWGKAAGTAAAAARHILEHWDATAGVFISDIPQGTLTARTRLFAEIGEARWAVRNSAALSQWMEQAAVERPESARLAASLSPLAADALITLALDQGDGMLDLIHAAIKDGAVFPEAALHTYRQAQLDRLTTFPDRYPPASSEYIIDLSEGKSPRAEFIIRLASEDLDTSQSEQLCAAAAAMSPRLEAVVTALCLEQQAHRNGRELTDAELDVLQTALEDLADDDAEEDPGRVHGSDELVRAAVTHLVPRRPETVPSVADIATSITLDTLEWLEVELPRLGHTVTLKAIRQLGSSDALTWLAKLDLDMTVLFDFLTSLDEEPLTLAPAQAWHLDEAAAFISVLGMRTVGALKISAAAVQQQPDLTRSLLRLTIKACGYGGTLISAQLRSLKEENTEKTTWNLLYRPSTRAPAPAHAAVAIDDDLLLQTLRHGNTWLVTLALTLADTAQLPSRLGTHLVTELPALGPRTRLRTAEFLARHWPGLSLPDDDAPVRAGAAHARAAALADSLRHRDAHPLLCDPDLLVREQTARGLTDIPTPELAVLEEALSVPAQQWTCLNCGAVVPAEVRECECGHTRPRVEISE
ncbi:NACHT domain-containing protein [Streptomyces sp. MBT58]|uniref:NACHT domain-containing protein n=1 Tax=Streptomyces sp. MBT58 TaxID=1488389 RepID=UPI00191196AE|nr:NACHT domain-containing protein [Streptomyces sp. MBT58]MBK5993678.1 NACHT domain-containing protein [Streptomyces sp. MBT58]